MKCTPYQARQAIKLIDKLTPKQTVRFIKKVGVSHYIQNNYETMDIPVMKERLTTLKEVTSSTKIHKLADELLVELSKYTLLFNGKVREKYITNGHILYYTTNTGYEITAYRYEEEIGVLEISSYENLQKTITKLQKMSIGELNYFFNYQQDEFCTDCEEQSYCTCEYIEGENTTTNTTPTTNIISLSSFKSTRTKTATNDNISEDSDYFKEIQKKNRERQERLKEERERANKSVKNSYRL